MIIKINIHHNLLKTNFIEIRFDTEMKIEEVKDKIYQMTGTPPSHQDLTLIRGPNNQVQLSPEHATLRDFGAESEMEIMCVDRNPMSMLTMIQNATEDVFIKMSDADYDKREGTVRAYKREKFQNDPEYRKKVLEAAAKREATARAEMEAIADIPVGSRCKVLSKNKTGTVRFAGAVEEQVGMFVGVELDQPVGNCAGESGKIKYFECAKGCGLFVKPQDVQIGAFEEDLGLEDSDEL